MIKWTGHTRKVDANGRLIVPSQLRDELKIKPNDIYEFGIMETEDGKTYLCIECYNLISEVERAKEVLRKAGFAVD